AGFALCALGMALMSLDSACHLAYLFTMSEEVAKVLRSPYWDWTVGVSITWGTLLGPYLLWGRWSEPHWRRRAGLLGFLNLVDGGFWVLRHGRTFGLWPRDVGHLWLRTHVVLGSSWVQFALFAGLAADLASHLGSKSAHDAGQKARALALVGGMIW